MSTITDSRYIRIEAAYFRTNLEVVSRRLNERIIEQMMEHARRDKTKTAYTHAWIPGAAGERVEYHHLIRYEAQGDRWSAKVVGKRFF